MANNSYVLTININGGQGTESPIAGTDDNKDTDKVNKKLLAAYAVARPFISKTQQMVLNQVQTDYANSELTERVRLGMAVGTKILDIGVSAAAGQSLATMLGISGPFGAVVGAVTAIAGTVMDLMSRVQEIANKKKIEDEGLEVLRGRAGIQFNKSRMGQ